MKLEKGFGKCNSKYNEILLGYNWFLKLYIPSSIHSRPQELKNDYEDNKVNSRGSE